MPIPAKWLSCLTAAALIGLTSTSASAQLTSAGLSCNNNNAMTAMTPDAIACSGAWNGNNKNQQADVLSQLQTDFGGSGWFIVGSDDDNSIFKSIALGTTGSMTFSSPITGIFAIALKASNQFSLYLFDGGTAGITTISYVTDGASVNKKGIPQGLSGATLYEVDTPVTTTPEPATYLLLLTGFGAIWFVKRSGGHRLMSIA